jgi:hypothetical protein
MTRYGLFDNGPALCHTMTNTAEAVMETSRRKGVVKRVQVG